MENKGAYPAKIMSCSSNTDLA